MTTDKKGRLTIYLGAAPGVGKTCEMLNKAHQLQKDGVDVVVGIVETHGRADTAALSADLETIPRARVRYRDTDFEEMDLHAIIERHPQVVLIDELAHTNATGMDNHKRWQDINQCLDAGIDVLSTLNIQHLESLGDVVSRITGTVQRETVPDAVVRAADEIELVDISPEQLQQRLRAGNVYRAERVDAALGNYFRLGNLNALRELSLLWLADRVDEALARYRESKRIKDTWETRERVLVAVTGGAESLTMVRRASRIASRASAELVVIHVLPSDGLTTAHRYMTEVRELAASVGASVHTVVGDDIPETLLEFARGINATQLVIGTSRRSRIQRLFVEGIGAAILRRSGSIDVHMVTIDSKAQRRPRRQPRPRLRRISAWLAAVLVPLLLTVVLQRFSNDLDLASLGSLYLVGVLAVSLLGGVWPATLGAIASAIALNYYFTPPTHSFTTAEPRNLLTLIVMLAVAIAVSVLVDYSTNRHSAAVASTRDADVLTLFARAALHSTSLEMFLDKVRDVYGQQQVSLESAEGETLAMVRSPQLPAGTPITGATTKVATTTGVVLTLWGDSLGAHDQRLLSVVAEHASALRRQQELSQVAAQTMAISEADKLRRSLLAAVGHDLRTPIAAAKLSVSSLRSDQVSFDPAETEELLATIEESVDHLSSLVDNLLDSSRLAAGAVRPDPRNVAIDAVAHQAVLAATVGTPELRERCIIDAAAVSAWADYGLLERVLANLLINALRHAPGSQVRVTAAYSGEGPERRTLISVADNGPGMTSQQRDQAFAPFHRSGDTNTSQGIGLGLSVARGFVEAMGGTISLTDTPSGGTTVLVELPSTHDAAEEESA